MSQETITIRVVTVGGVKSLDYSGTAGVTVVAATPGSKAKHGVGKGTEVRWTCSDGGFGIQFIGKTSPFTDGTTMQLISQSGVPTPFKKTRKAANRKRPFEYVAVVSQAGNPPLVMEDPDLEVSDDPGGGGKRKARRATPKKGAAKRKR